MDNSLVTGDGGCGGWLEAVVAGGGSRWSLVVEAVVAGWSSLEAVAAGWSSSECCPTESG
ncbi:unnamed protein product [Ilex paraguariensis]|uniref:Uncharacterized protein n=1 Tax=Ilex paraguariensis TaxID=185542 RepID=A0ABC8TAG8_9AQUA